MADVLGSGTTLDAGTTDAAQNYTPPSLIPQTGDSLSSSNVGAPDMPDVARYIPYGTLQDAQNQEDADAWGAQQNQTMANEWANAWQAQASDFLTGLIANPQSYQPPDAPFDPNALPTSGALPSATPAGPPTPDQTQPTEHPFIGQLVNGIGGLIDKLAGALPNAPNTQAQGQSLAQANPATLGGVATIAGTAAQPLQAVAGELNPLTVGNQISGAIEGAEGIKNPQPPPSIPVLTGAANVAGALTSPTMEAEALGAPEAVANAARTVAASGPAGRLAMSLPGELGGVAMDAVIRARGIPAIAGGSEDAIPIAREALTADHPIVQAVSTQTGADPAAVERLIQSPGFDPVALAKNSGRLGTTQTAALGAYKAASDAELANALIKAAGDATGKAELTADDIWNNAPGIGMHAAAPTETPAVDAMKAGQIVSAGKPPVTPAATGNSFGDLWDTVNRGIVQAKMMNPLIHIPNLLSETGTQFLDPRMNPVAAFAQAETAMRDPEALASLMQEAPKLNVAGTYRSANDLSATTQSGLKNVPVVGGIKNLADKVTQVNHDFLFGTVAKKLQLASYYGARNMGSDPDVAAAYANAKFGQIPKSDQNAAMQWISQHAAFAGRWIQGTGIQLGSLIGNPTFGGYARDLTPAQQAQLATALRGDFMKGVGMLAAAHTALNYGLSGHGPWQNEPGRWLDVDTGQKDAQGRPIYVTDPFFRRVQDAMHLLAVPIPGNPIAKAEGTTTTAALANKAAPLIGTAASLASGSQYLSPTDQPPGVTGGPPIIAPGSDLTDALKQAAAFVVNQVSPVQVNAKPETRSPEGIKLTQPELSVGVGPESAGTSSAGAAVGNVVGTLGALTGINPAVGARDIGTKDEYFQQQDQAAYGDLAKPFQAAGVQLTELPSTVTRGTGPKAEKIPTTAADKPAFQEAYKAALTKGLAQKPNASKSELTTIERTAFDAGQAAVLKGISTDEANRRMGIAAGKPDVWSAALGSPSPTPSAPKAPVAAGAGTSSAWTKALAK